VGFKQRHGEARTEVMFCSADKIQSSTGPFSCIVYVYVDDLQAIFFSKLHRNEGFESNAPVQLASTHCARLPKCTPRLTIPGA
jgi:hypothetical protein